MTAWRQGGRDDGNEYAAELIDELRIVLADDLDGADAQGNAMQTSLNVLLRHIRAINGRNGLDANAVHTLSKQIKALQDPLTQLLAQRLERLDPTLPPGRALFAAAAEARSVCSIGLQFLT